MPKISLSSGDSVLGIGDNGEFPLLFTTHHGVLSVTPTQGGMRNESMNLTENLLLDKSSSKLSDSLHISVSAQVTAFVLSLKFFFLNYYIFRDLRT